MPRWEGSLWSQVFSLNTRDWGSKWSDRPSQHGYLPVETSCLGSVNWSLKQIQGEFFSFLVALEIEPRTKTSRARPYDRTASPALLTSFWTCCVLEAGIEFPILCLYLLRTGIIGVSPCGWLTFLFWNRIWFYFVFNFADWFWIRNHLHWPVGLQVDATRPSLEFLVFKVIEGPGMCVPWPVGSGWFFPFTVYASGMNSGHQT